MLPGPDSLGELSRKISKGRNKFSPFKWYLAYNILDLIKD